MIIEMPEEIEQALNLPYGYTILVKGMPGSGKTTFILHVVKKYSEAGKAIYISTRVTPDGLQMQFPHVKALLPNLQFLDASQTFLPPLSESEIQNTIQNTLQFTTIDEFIAKFSERIELLQNPLVIIDSWEGLFTQLKEKGK